MVQKWLSSMVASIRIVGWLLCLEAPTSKPVGGKSEFRKPTDFADPHSSLGEPISTLK